MANSFPPRQAAILLSPPSLCCVDVANRARPFAQFRNPAKVMT
jgi:hypothetical protein